MQILNTDDNIASVKLSVRELTTLSNALNEVCNGMDIFEFETRLGVSIQEARKLLKEMGELISNTEVTNK